MQYSQDLSDVNIAGKRIPHRPIRIAIGVEGVYKFEPDKDEVSIFLAFNALFFMLLLLVDYILELF